MSLNSFREPCYEAYFRPKGYQFSDVLKSVDLGIQLGRHVAINYLNMSGVTDSPEEASALMAFLKDNTIHQIQWRNLNFDPLRYYKIMRDVAPNGAPIGMKNLLKQIRQEFPYLKFGYFNPPKERFDEMD